MRQSIFNNEKGFTIVETLIALTIFSIAVAGIITVTVQGGTSTTATRNRMVANYLAQEGIELMRGYRDSSVLATPGDASLGWNNFVSSVSGCVASQCNMNATNPSAPVGCASTGCPLVYTASGFYTSVGTGTATPYSRKINLASYGSNEIEILSTVTWKEGSADRTITVQESIFNWYETI